MRIAPEEHHLEDGERHRGGADLGDVGDVARPLPPGEAREGPAAVEDLAAGRREEAGQEPQESGLPRPVGPHHHQALAGEDVEVERPQDRPRSRPPGEAAGGEERRTAHRGAFTAVVDAAVVDAASRICPISR